MLRTTTKKAIENIRAYIISIFNGYNYEIETPATFKEAATFINKCFEEEYYTGYNAMHNRKDMFIEWCAGLPSVIDTCYYYNRSAVEDLGNILEETPEERSRYTEEDAERMLTCLIYREIMKEVR